MRRRGRTSTRACPAEFTNWRDEQQAWQQTSVLFDQSFHMAELAVDRPRRARAALRARRQQLRRLRAGQGQALRAVHARGIRDRRRDPVRSGREHVQPRRPRPGAQLGHVPRRDGWSTTCRCELDQRSALRTDGRRKHYRFQVQGPNAMQVIEKVLGQSPPELKFFNLTRRDDRRQDRRRASPRDGRSAGLGAVRALGRPRGRPRGAARRRRGVRPAPGGRARVLVEHARVGLDPLAAARPCTRATASRRIASGLPATGYEANASIGGSFVSDDVEDYYFTPWDLGYGSYVKFDHDFIGREALEAHGRRRASP